MGLGQGVERRHGQCTVPAPTTPEREGRATQMSRTPAPGPARCGARSRLTLIGTVPGARAAGTARHPNRIEVPHSGPPTPAADARRGRASLGRC